MGEHSDDVSRLSRIKSSLIKGAKGATVATIIGSSLTGSAPQPVAHEPIPLSGQLDIGGPEIVLTDRADIKARLLSDYGVTIFDPEKPIYSSDLVREYKSIGGRIPSSEFRISGVTQGVAIQLISRTAQDAGISYENIPHSDLEGINKHNRVVIPWSESTLNLIRNILSSLPSKFIKLYQDKSFGDQIEMYLVDTPQKEELKDRLELLNRLGGFGNNDDTGGMCTCYRGDGHPSLILFRDTMESRVPYVREWNASTITHELTHLIILQRLEESGDKTYDRLTQEALTAMGIVFDGEVSYSKESPVPVVTDIFRSHGVIRLAYDKDGNEYLQPVSYIGNAVININEFLPWVVDQYILGKEAFSDAYAPLGEVRLEKLYRFIQEKFFGGHEFAKGEIIRAVSNSESQ